MRSLCTWVGVIGIAALVGCSRSGTNASSDKSPDEPEIVADGTSRAQKLAASKSQADWEKMLKSQNESECNLALSAAIGMGPKAAPLLPTLLTVTPTRFGTKIEGSDWIQPLVIAIGSDAIPHVLAATKSPDSKVRERAIAWMARTVPAPAELDSCYAAALTDSDVAVRKAALEHLATKPLKKISFGATLERLLDSPDSGVRSSAAFALATGDPRRSPAKTARALYELLSAPHSRSEEILPLFSALSPEAIPEIMAGAKIESTYAWAALRVCGPAAATEMASLLKDNNHSSPYLGFEFAEFGPAAKKAVPKLLEVAQDPDNSCRIVAIIALAGIDPIAGEAQALRMLEEPKGRSRSGNQYFTVAALALTGSEKAIDAASKYNHVQPYTFLARKMPEKMSPILRKYAANCTDVGTADLVFPFVPDEQNLYRVWLKELEKNPGVVTSGFGPLDRAVKLHGKSALAILRKLMEDPDKAIQFKAAYATVHFEPSNIDAARFLVANTPRVWHQVLMYHKPLARPEAALAVSVVVQQLESEKDPYIIACHLRTIGKMGPNAKDAAPKLRQYLDNPNPSLRYLAASALARIEPGNKDSGPILKSLLETKFVASQTDVLNRILEVEKGRGSSHSPVVEIAETLYSFDPELAVRSGICHPAFGLPNANLHLGTALPAR